MQEMVPQTKTTPHRALGFGVRFNPSAEEAIALYLRRRIVGEQLPDVAGIIHEAAVYTFEPKYLAAAYPRLPRTQNRFFFTTCKRQKAGKGHRMSRAAGPGSWVSEVKKEVKNSAGETIGVHETLKYAYRDKSRKSEWRMDEYRCCGLDQLAVVDGEERVLCRVYVSPNSKEGSLTLQESAAGDRLLGMPEPARAMAAAADQQQQQKPRQEPATAMAVQQQQQQPRRQEPAAPALPAIRQPQAIKKPPPPRALDLSSGPLQRRVTNTVEAPKRPAPQVAEPPFSKRMRPTLAPLKVPLPARHDVVTQNTPKQPSRWCPPAAMPQHQQQASPKPSPRATPRPRPRLSSRSRPVAPPPPPVPEAPTTNVIDEDDYDELDLEEVPVAKEHEGEIQEEAGNDDDDGFQSFLEMLASELEVEEMPAVEEHGGKGKIQEEGQHQHQHARSLEGFVADERGDDVTAQDAWNTLSDMGDTIDGAGDTDFSLPLSAYGDIQY